MWVNGTFDNEIDHRVWSNAFETQSETDDDCSCPASFFPMRILGHVNELHQEINLLVFYALARFLDGFPLLLYLQHQGFFAVFVTCGRDCFD